MTGDLAGAERHLAALKEICLLPCEGLKDLERADCRVSRPEVATRCGDYFSGLRRRGMGERRPIGRRGAIVIRDLDHLPPAK